MPLCHAAHAVYDTQYHLVWTPKYRKAVLGGMVGVRLDALLREIAAAYEVSVTELYVGADHLHLLITFIYFVRFRRVTRSLMWSVALRA